jgi:signal transduction histidine kinase
VPADLLRQLTRDSTTAAEARGLFLRVDADAESWQAWVGPAGVIGKVLALLLDNALKFTSQGGITVTVTAGAAESLGRARELVFSVSDTGVGLSPQQLEWIRIPFAQADGGMTRRSSGIGLGLPLAKRLVRAAGGELALSGEEGRGATARFTVRAEVAAGRVTPPPGVRDAA